MNRRGFLGGLFSSLAAPAIIRTPGLLMAISPPLRVFRGFGLAPLKFEGASIPFDTAYMRDILLPGMRATRKNYPNTGFLRIPSASRLTP